MPKQVIVSMEEEYPFGQCEEVSSQNVRVLVRKIYEVSAQQRNRLVEKVNILRRLKNQHMIKIESVLEEEESVHFLFEYIPIKVETWISNINDQFIQNFRDQLIKFSSFLANNGIKIDFQLKNIGMDHNYNAKYFLDLNFDIIPLHSKEKLKSLYIRDITSLFKPYLANSSFIQPTKSDRDNPKNVAKSTSRVQDTSISPPTNKNNPANKQKNLNKFKPEVNMSVDSENEQILQDIMGVLDNDEDEEETTGRGSDLKYTQNSAPEYSTQQFYSQKEYPPPPNQNNSYSQKNILTGNNYNQSKKSQIQSKKMIPLNAFSKPANKASKSKQLIDTAEYMRESMELQNRVRQAIQKSVSAIKRFREIRDNLQD